MAGAIAGMSGEDWMGLGGWDTQVDFGPRGAQGGEHCDLLDHLESFSLSLVSLLFSEIILPRPTRKAIANTAHEIIGTMSVLVNRSVIIFYILLSLLSSVSLSSSAIAILNGNKRFDDLVAGGF